MPSANTTRERPNRETDRMLLELAAKAAGYASMVDTAGQWYQVNGDWVDWNPLAHDRDAFRLAVQLNIDFMGQSFMHDGTPCRSAVFPINGDYDGISEPERGDPYEAARKVIVRAAAEIGRSMAAA